MVRYERGEIINSFVNGRDGSEGDMRVEGVVKVLRGS